ncbi:MAG TPA: hypothetical protein VJH34_04560 [archaeon]|nr:hypothetical protein [archaeon]
MSLPHFVKRAGIGILIALAATFLLKGSSYSNVVFLSGLAIAGFPGTIIIMLTPLQSVLTGTTVGFWFIHFPLLYVWVAIDIFDFLMHLPVLKTLFAVFTLGIAVIVRQIPFLIKIGLILFFAQAALTTGVPPPQVTA